MLKKVNKCTLFIPESLEGFKVNSPKWNRGIMGLKCQHPERVKKCG